ncbi:MAG: hypothetical protein E7311_02495 [Clostridiales bacterium]|nr:hypothetical protein [Clostridiales bacterium]
MQDGVRKLYQNEGEFDKLFFDVHELIEEVFPDIKCYIIDVTTVKNLIRSFVGKEDLVKLETILSKRYPLEGKPMKISDISSTYYYSEEKIKQILQKVEDELEKEENRVKLFRAVNFDIPERFIDGCIPEIYEYIIQDVDDFKKHLNRYQFKVLQRLILYPKIKKSLAVYLFEYLEDRNGYALRKCPMYRDILQELKVATQGEMLLKKNGISNILELILKDNISNDVKKYFFDEYSEYIIALLANSKEIVQILLNCYYDDNQFKKFCTQKEERDISLAPIEELDISKSAYKLLKYWNFNFITSIPKSENAIRASIYCNRSIASEIKEALINWYERNKIPFKDKDILIKDIDFSVRTFNILNRAGYERITDIPTDVSKLQCIWNCGPVVINEIVEKLKSFNIIVK